MICICLQVHLSTCHLRRLYWRARQWCHWMNGEKQLSATDKQNHRLCRWWSTDWANCRYMPHVIRIKRGGKSCCVLWVWISAYPDWVFFLVFLSLSWLHSLCYEHSAFFPFNVHSSVIHIINHTACKGPLHEPCNKQRTQQTYPVIIWS
jgi:hypothetical protein